VSDRGGGTGRSGRCVSVSVVAGLWMGGVLSGRCVSGRCSCGVVVGVGGGGTGMARTHVEGLPRQRVHHLLMLSAESLCMPRVQLLKCYRRHISNGAWFHGCKVLAGRRRFERHVDPLACWLPHCQRLRSCVEARAGGSALPRGGVDKHRDLRGALRAFSLSGRWYPGRVPRQPSG
jgi:hypothetical protein